MNESETKIVERLKRVAKSVGYLADDIDEVRRESGHDHDAPWGMILGFVLDANEILAKAHIRAHRIVRTGDVSPEVKGK